MSEQTSSRRQSNNDLVSFAGPVFDLILRLKSGIVQPSNELRPQITQLLKDFEERALRYRYRESIIQVAKFALASFVDETVLTNNFPLKEDWERYPIQLEHFGEQLAGNKFYDKLEAMLRQIDVTADAVEVYYVCMLLGFKGRYAVYEQDKLLQTMQRTADALVKVGKISKVELSPHWLVEDQPVPVERKGMPTWAKVTALGGFCFAVIIYLMMFLLSYKFLDDAMSTLGL
ncbi:MAG: type IVB secretion system protein IcmH/DotU [Pyrinomonadaceae bacterium]|nr:type IVB secretion system protein IcmH/DotU [Pyrinomonadaceae bacterium]